MRNLVLYPSEDPVSSNIIQVLQLRTANDPWLSGLKTFQCDETTEAFTPFIPLLLFPKTTEIKIGFIEDVPTVVVASMLARLSTLCPNLESITLHSLPSDPIITEAVSEMVLGCNRDALQTFRVDSPLTEEAREVVYRLPKLSRLWAVIRGPVSLPAVALPNLAMIDVEYDDLAWLRGFRGATLEKLESVNFRSESGDIGDFLGAFESVALSVSAQNTLSDFAFYTSRSWNPNYSSLLSFNHLKDVEIESSCGDGCSSRVDDDIIASLARAMPKLETLRLGDQPCSAPTGITVNGLISLACGCPRLSRLRVHFQALSLVTAATGPTIPSPSDDEAIPPRREDCALVELEVGETPVSTLSGFTVALVLFRVFPRITNVKYIDWAWQTVQETIEDCRRVDALLHHSSKTHLSSTAFTIPSDVQPGNAFNRGRPEDVI